MVSLEFGLIVTPGVCHKNITPLPKRTLYIVLQRIRLFLFHVFLPQSRIDPAGYVQKSLLMERIKAVPLQQQWHKMPEKMRGEILMQLQGYVSQLRPLDPPKPGQVGAVDYMALVD